MWTRQLLFSPRLWRQISFFAGVSAIDVHSPRAVSTNTLWFAWFADVLDQHILTIGRGQSLPRASIRSKSQAEPPVATYDSRDSGPG